MAVSSTITAREPTAKFVAHWCAETPLRRPLQGFEAPLSNRKIHDVLGSVEEHNWRKYVLLLLLFRLLAGDRHKLVGNLYP
jgi:hypothetical protein